MSTGLTAGVPANKERELALRAGKDASSDGVFRGCVMAAGLFVLLSLAAAALSMLWGGRQAFLTFGWHFLISTEWDAVNHNFGAFVPIIGTLVTALIAMIIAVPVSFGIALFLTEVSPTWMRGPVSSAIELLAGIPSIIYGMWGLFVFVPVVANYIAPFLNDRRHRNDLHDAAQAADPRLHYRPFRLRTTR